MSKVSLLFCFLYAEVLLSQVSPNKIISLEKNILLNPGAENSENNLPKYWKTDFIDSEIQSEWWSTYGVTSHEWNSGNKMLGLPNNSGNNYFRLVVDREEGKRENNLYQDLNLTNYSVQENGEELFYLFQGNIASAYFNPKNCSFAELKMFLFDENHNKLDEIIFHATPSDFKDLDTESSWAKENGFSVMHEFKLFSELKKLPPSARKVRVEMYALFPCDWTIDSDYDEEKHNIFFFDNISLEIYKKAK